MTLYLTLNIYKSVREVENYFFCSTAKKYSPRQEEYEDMHRRSLKCCVTILAILNKAHAILVFFIIIIIISLTCLQKDLSHKCSLYLKA